MKLMIKATCLLMGIGVILILGNFDRVRPNEVSSIVVYMNFKPSGESPGDGYDSNWIVEWGDNSNYRHEYPLRHYSIMESFYSDSILTISSQKRWALIKDGAMSLRLVEIDTGTTLHRYQISHEYYGELYLPYNDWEYEWSPDETKLVVPLTGSDFYYEHLVLDLTSNTFFFIESSDIPQWLDNEWLIVTSMTDLSIAKIRWDNTERSVLDRGYLSTISHDNQWLFISGYANGQSEMESYAMHIDWREHYALPMACCTLSPDGKWLANTQHIMNVATREIVHTMEALHSWDNGHFFGFASDSSFLVYETKANDALNFVLWSTAQQTAYPFIIEDKMQTLYDNMTALAPDNRWLVVHLDSANTFLIDLVALQEGRAYQKELPDGKYPSWQGEWLYTLDTTDGEIYRYHPTTQRRELVTGNVQPLLEHYSWSGGDQSYLVARSDSYKGWLVNTQTLRASSIGIDVANEVYSLPMVGLEYHSTILGGLGMALGLLGLLRWKIRPIQWR